MSEELLEDGYEIVTTATQLAPAPPRRRKLVPLPNVPTSNGKKAALWVYSTSALELDDYQASNRVVDGTKITLKMERSDLRYLWYVIGDHRGNKMWPDAEACARHIGTYDQSDIDLLLAAANKLNGASKEEHAGNSDGTPSDDGSGTSA